MKSKIIIKMKNAFQKYNYQDKIFSLYDNKGDTILYNTIDTIENKKIFIKLITHNEKI